MNKNFIVCLFLISLVGLSPFISIAAATDLNNQTITVQQAKDLMDSSTNAIIVDVRNETEYQAGHLNGAILLPLYRIENFNWADFQEYTGPSANIFQLLWNHDLIIYCKSGSRSVIACNILSNHGFNVCNIQGGIVAWMQAGYPIYTKYHMATVNLTHSEADIQIQPWLLYQSTCQPCQDLSKTVVDLNPSINGSQIVSGSIQGGTTTSIPLKLNNTQYDVNLTKIALSSFNEFSEGFNRTITVWSTASKIADVTNELIYVEYTVKSGSFNMSVRTILSQLDSQSYNASITKIAYKSVQNPFARTSEAVKFYFNGSALTLSEVYQTLRQTANKITKEYEKDTNVDLQELSSDYSTMANELKFLSINFKNNMPEFDLAVTNATAATFAIGANVGDPDVVSNGSFESSQYWVFSGDNGQHSLSSADYSSSPYSALVGWRDYGPAVMDTWDGVYQEVYVPDDATNLKLWWDYHYLTYAGEEGRFMVYATREGNNPSWVFGRGGITQYVLDDFGWVSAEVDLDYEYYAGHYAYLYFSTYNLGVNDRQWAYVDDVRLTYDLPNSEWYACVSTCVIGFCMDYFMCEFICVPSCGVCVFTYVSCIPCAACLAAWGIWCLATCSI